MTSASVMPPTLSCSSLIFTSGCSSLVSSFSMASIEPRTSARRMMLSVCTSPALSEPIEQVFQRDVLEAGCAERRRRALARRELRRSRGPGRCRPARRTGSPAPGATSKPVMFTGMLGPASSTR